MTARPVKVAAGPYVNFCNAKRFELLYLVKSPLKKQAAILEEYCSFEEEI